MKNVDLSKIRPEAAPVMALCQVIERQRAVVDSRLRYPAAWRGEVLRRTESGELPKNAFEGKYGAAFNFLRQANRENRALEPGLLLEVARRLAGIQRYREIEVKGAALPKQIRAFTGRALERSQDGKEPAPLAAARLHLELQVIRPFARSNGRVARLMASYVLMRAGYRSTLFTAVEQHVAPYPGAYAKAFETQAATPGNPWVWLTFALEAMAVRSREAAWFCRREDELRKAGRKLGLKGTALERALIDFDTGAEPKGALAIGMKGIEAPLPVWRKHMGETTYAEMLSQVRRLRDEQVDDAKGK